MKRTLAALLVLVIGCQDDEPEPAEPADADVGAPEEVSGDVTEDAPDGVLDAGPRSFVEKGPGLGIDYAETDPGSTPRYDPLGTDWLAVGWPHDARRTEDGHVDLSIFPNPGSDLLAEYLVYGQEILDGFGLNGGIYFEMFGGVAVTSFPDPAESRDPLAVAQLVNASPDSAHYGEQWPLEFRVHGLGSDPFYHPNTVVMRAIFGYPLTEGETWCAVLTRGLRDDKGRYLTQSPEFAAALFEEPALAPLLAWLDDSPLHSTDLATGTCFTTHRPTEELRAVRDWLDGAELPEVTLITEPGVHGEVHGTYEAPNFQAGEKPYETDGDLQLDAAGDPIVQSMETIRFLMLVPRDTPMPEAGWPVVLYAHGTGGDYDSCKGVAGDLRGIGLAVVCIDQPLHGSRGPEGLKNELDNTQLVTSSFNFLNPRAGRTNFRQSTIDSMVLARLVAGGGLDRGPEETLTGETMTLDPARIYFFGHSHGGLSGSLLLGIDPLIGAAVISGAGGGLINTVLLRKDPLDIAELLRAILLVTKENFDAFHPSLSIVQMMVDVTDPINYAPHWLDGRHVYVTEGTADHASAPVTTNSLAAAGGLPLILPIAKSSPAHDLRGAGPLSKPFSGNTQGVTAAIEQWQDGTHWVAFDEWEASATWLTFLRTLVEDGEPTLGVGEIPVPVPVATLAGDTCEAAGELPSAPLEVRGNTSLLGDQLVSCAGGGGAGRRDAVYRFTAHEAGSYRFRLAVPPKADKDDPPTGPNLLYLTRDCTDEAACVGQASGGEIWTDLEQDEWVFVVVDGTSALHVGPFAVEIVQGCSVQECGDRECGSAGCTWCGDCAAAEYCTPDGSCEAVGPGDTCADPLEVGELPFAAAANSDGFLGDYHYENGWCPGFNAAYGKASNDVAWHWVVPETATWELRLDSDFDATLYLVSDCADIAGSCLSAARNGGGERLVVDLDAGQEVFLIVDGASNNHNRRGNYTLRVGTCQPWCETKACGSDGCGGSCGQCATEDRCVEEDGCDPLPTVCTPTAQCEPMLPGEDCGVAIPVDALPFQHAGTTEEMVDDSQAPSSCPGESKTWGGKSPDAVYVFEPAADAIYKVTLSADWDAALYATSDCQDVGAGCLGSDNVDKKSGEKLYLTLAAGAPVFIVVDGASKDSHEGDYTLQVSECTPSCSGKECGSDGCGGSCGGCAQTQECSGSQCGPRKGDACAKAIQVGKLPWKHDANPTQYTAADDADPCAQADPAHSAVWYRLDPGSAGTWAVSVTGGATLGIQDGCGGECVGTSAADLELAQGEERWFRVSGAGSWTIHVKKLCFPVCDDAQCGGDGCGGVCGDCTAPNDLCIAAKCLAPADLEGDTCQAPFVVGALPFKTTADTTGARNNYGVGEGGCAGWVAKGAASSDHAWRFEPPAPGTYVIEVASQGWDSATTVTSDCAAIDSTCLGLDDGLSVDRLELELDGPVFVVVDGASNEQNARGPYTLQVYEAD